MAFDCIYISFYLNKNGTKSSYKVKLKSDIVENWFEINYKIQHTLSLSNIFVHQKLFHSEVKLKIKEVPVNFFEPIT